MFYLVVKALISGIVIAEASEVAKRFPGFGTLIDSLPLVSVAHAGPLAPSYAGA